MDEGVDEQALLYNERVLSRARMMTACVSGVWVRSDGFGRCGGSFTLAHGETPPSPLLPHIAHPSSTGVAGVLCFGACSLLVSLLFLLNLASSWGDFFPSFSFLLTSGFIDGFTVSLYPSSLWEVHSQPLLLPPFHAVFPSLVDSLL